MLRDTIRAKGHPNITARHKTTLQITKDENISKRADCIIAVSADKAVSDLTAEVKAALKTRVARVQVSICAAHTSQVVTGSGSAGLTHADAHDTVIRKSAFVSGRTLMINADKAAADLDRHFIDKLKKAIDVIITIEVDL
ncbi:MAG TPA: DUF371 domain-containing protein [Candidatus Acidoferrales bacterium]|nr:DUF371 domain-containing protein [Candidatus Acidoferrales bacterium]